jgi:hypothetical protein
MDGLFLVALGGIFFLLGLLGAFPMHRLTSIPRSARRPLAISGEQKIGSYAAMALGGVLIVIGLIGALVQVLN